MNDTVIKVERVSKKYCRSLNQTMFYGMQDIARNVVGLNSNSNKLRNGEFWALDDVSFEVKKGETLGIIGANGSGKTTLLKLINGIFMPDKGRIEIKGRVGALIEVGAGFHPMLTGRENIYVNGSILGMTKKEIDKKFDEIVAFADIGDFIDSPVKHYSSGMYVRLGFAIAVHCEPDILLIDEVLAVGDMAFQTKCMEKIKEMQDKGVNIVFVSHNLDSVIGVCQYTLYLKAGQVKAMGNSSTIVSEYRNEFKTMIFDKNSAAKGRLRLRKPTDKLVEITAIQLLASNGEEREIFKTGEELIVRISFFAHKRIQKPVFGVAAYKSDGTCIYACNTKYDNVEIHEIEGEGFVGYRIPRLNLLSGTYLLTVGILEEKISAFYDLWEKACQFNVATHLHDHGTFYLEHLWDIQNIKNSKVDHV